MDIQKYQHFIFTCPSEYPEIISILFPIQYKIRFENPFFTHISVPVNHF